MIKDYNMQIDDIIRSINVPLNITSEQNLNNTLGTSFAKTSLGIEMVLMLVFLFMLAISISRVARNVRNPKIMPRRLQIDYFVKQRNQNDELIKKFHFATKNNKSRQAVDEQTRQQIEEKTQSKRSTKFGKVSQMVTQLDSELLFLQPYLVGSIASVLIFAANSSCLVLLVATLTLFTLFNVLMACSHVKWASMLFLIPALGSLIPLFFTVSLPQ